MPFVPLKVGQLAAVYKDGKQIDLVTIRNVQKDGLLITTQSEHVHPGTMDEFLYIPRGILRVDGQALQVSVAGWRLMFWHTSRTRKCVNPYSYVYDIKPVPHAHPEPVLKQ